MPVSGKAVLPMTCSSCHGKDDVHDGAFGRQCDKCHGVDSFKQIKLRMGRVRAPEKITTSDVNCPTVVRGLCRDWQRPALTRQAMLAAGGEAR
jgi:hypothetical protein